MNGCDGKTPYYSVGHAASVVKYIQKRRGKCYLRIYCCPHCRAFHLTGERR